MVSNIISPTRGPRAFKSSSSNLLLTDKRCVFPIPKLPSHKTENETPSGSDVLRTTNQTNHAKFRSRMLPAHGTIQLRVSATGVFKRAKRHRGIPGENRREEPRNQRVESTN